MRFFQVNRLSFVVIYVIMLGIPTFASAQVSSTEKAVMDKILKLKGEIDLLMMTPGSSSDKVAMDKVMDMKRDIDTFLALLSPHLQAQVRKKMAQPKGQSSGAMQSGGAGAENLPFVMAPQEVQAIEMALMRSQINMLKRMGMALRQKGTLDAGMQGQWVQLVESVSGSGMETDVPSMTKYVMREAYAAENEGLETLSGKVRFYREMRSKLREEIVAVKKVTDAVPGEDGALSEMVRKKRFSLGLDGGVAQQMGEDVKTKAGAVQYLEELEKQLAKTNEDAEKTNLAFEDMLLKQKPKLNAMSEMSQKLQEAGNAVVQGGR